MKTIAINVTRADLWGNMKDGFDWNDSYKQPQVVVETTNVHYAVLKRVRDVFTGLMLARTENRSLPMQRDNIKVEWQDEYFFDVMYLGHIVGSGSIEV